jgi:hypothetical protein
MDEIRVQFGFESSVPVPAILDHSDRKRPNREVHSAHGEVTTSEHRLHQRRTAPVMEFRRTNMISPHRGHIAKLSMLVSSTLTAVLLLTGCYFTLEQRWAAFDAQMQKEIGVKTKDYYIREWGAPAKRTKAPDGGETLTWESRGYGGNQGWNKILTFTSDGVLKGVQRDYWPKELWGFGEAKY